MDTDTCSSCVLKELNIIDIERRCRRHLFHKAPNLKRALISLETLAAECKAVTDRLGLEYHTPSLFHFLKDLPINLAIQREKISSHTKLKYLYFKRKLLGILKGNPFKEYTEWLRERLKSRHQTDEMEEIVRNVLKVCRIFNIQAELFKEEVYQYEFLAELLNLCHEYEVRDSRLFISLLKKVIDMYVIEFCRTVTQPEYAAGFFKYVLENSTKEKLDLGHYCRSRPLSLWEYSRNFSIISAIALGNVERTMLLLQYGFEVFPENELKRSGHGFPFMDEVMPTSYLMTLQVMSRIRSVNLLLLHSTGINMNGLYIATKDQKECFRLIWRAIPEPYVKHSQLALSVSTEYFYLALHAIFDSIRYKRNSNFCEMYETCFKDLASSPNEPRSLKHLCRCAIRDRLRKHFQLPRGIFQLGLPWIVEHYLNLENNLDDL